MTKYIRLKISNFEFALPLLDVLYLFDDNTLVELDNLEKKNCTGIIGKVSNKLNVIPVLDTSAILGKSTGAGGTRKVVVINSMLNMKTHFISTNKRLPAGFIVDEILGIIEVRDEMISKDRIINKSDLIDGEIIYGEEIYCIVNISKIFNDSQQESAIIFNRLVKEKENEKNSNKHLESLYDDAEKKRKIEEIWKKNHP